MTSEAIERAVREVTRPTRPTASPTGADTTDADVEAYSLPLVRDPELCWRRVVLRQLLCLQVAWTRVLFTEVVDLEPRRSSEPPAPTEAPSRRTVPRAELLMRQKLPPSQSTRDLAGLIPVSECRHREIVRRGGRTFWFTCKGCNSRWPREQDEYLEED